VYFAYGCGGTIDTTDDGRQSDHLAASQGQ
jgi:hypothetical protein